MPNISVPRGGGAIRGIGEKFATSLVSGTGSTTIPIAISPGRSGFGPQLTLSYDSGNGNGIFGFGWSLSLPEISRKTSKGLPVYDDAAESDVFLISDAEDLVQARDPGKQWSRISRVDGGYLIDRYRPRSEGLFARIERWTRLADGDVHWRSITRDNVTTTYGEDGGSRIADPGDPGRIFRWLISRSHDDKGNALVYEYIADNDHGVDTSAAHERHRSPAVRATNRYPKRIRYGNQVSRLVDPSLSQAGWMFEVVFDYGDHDPDLPVPVSDRPWQCRPDPYSSYRSGFEVRTYRQCRRVLMFHHFPAKPEVGADCLVKSTSFTYAPGEAAGAVMTTVVQSGHKRSNGGYLTRSLPPVQLEYSQVQLHDDVGEIDAANLTGDGHQWVDLNGEGLPGVLAEQASGWYYRSNLGEGRFAAAVAVAPVPSTAGASATQLLDLAGDGCLDVVTLDGPVPGFFERDAGATGWEAFVPFGSLPAIDWGDPNLRFVDLDGDGQADVLVTTDEALTWYPSLKERGFGAAQRATTPLDPDRGPRLVFADVGGSIHLADMSGDGLTDIVRIGNGEVCYWPNLGYGRFGAKVSMDDAPWFDRAELFHPRFLRLADVDGSGVADIIYLGHDGARIYLNRNGNAWSAGHLIASAPRADNRIEVSTVDLFGTGTTCLVWPAGHAWEASRRLRYVDLLGSAKPHLLVRMVNNMGAETHVHYASSTRFSLADAAAGRPWQTRLSFPVQVVERIETIDRISHTRFVTRYAYHHGFFDGEEGEFRGFGMVEQWDTEEFTALEGTFDVPAVLTKTWFHTGAFVEPGQSLSRHFESEYWHEPGLTAAQQQALLLEDTVMPETIRLPDGVAVPHRLSDDEAREACRALKGKLLRQETYAQDGSDAEARPYQVIESNYSVDLYQPRLPGDRHAVCYAYSRENLTYHYERALSPDPRVSHLATLEVDSYGNVLRSITVGYGRRDPEGGADSRLPQRTQEAIREEQTRLRVALAVNRFTNLVADAANHRAPMPCESRQYELFNAEPASGGALLRWPQLRTLAEVASDGAHDLSNEDIEGTGITGPGPWRRLVEHARIFYRRDDLAGTLPLGRLEPLAMPGERHQLALTAGLIASVYGPLVTEDVLAGEAGYVHSEADGDWWIPSGLVFASPAATDSPQEELAHARQHFFLPHRLQDPFGATTTVHYEHDLLVAMVVDAIGNAVSADNDFRVLQPGVVTDANGNRTATIFDALGLVTGTAVMGKPGEAAGDSPQGFAADLDAASVVTYFQDPLADPGGLVHRATTRMIYDLDVYQRTRQDPQPQPVAMAALARERHDADLDPGQQSRITQRLAFFDGLGREIQRKDQAEPGAQAAPRWVASGWTIFNNKGLPVRQYEPFFTLAPGFEFGHAEGVSPIFCYDPVGRRVATVHPDRSWEKVTFDPWRFEKWDSCDTVLSGDPSEDADVGGLLARLPAGEIRPTWFEMRQSGGLGPAAQDAAAKTAVHAGTPSVTYLDSLGRDIVVSEDNIDAVSAIQSRLDVTGKVLAVVDQLGRPAAEHRYDVAGRMLVDNRIDAGTRRMLDNAVGKRIRTWDDRGHTSRIRYDLLQRPVETWITAADQERLAVQTVYGEAQGDAGNHRGRVFRRFDGSGVITHEAYDFKGNLLRSSMRVLTDHRSEVDWSAGAGLDAEVFAAASTFDALNRPTTQTTPDSSTVHFGYNEAGLLERIQANLQGSQEATPFLAGADYNAKGQRLAVELGNGTRTGYEYDPLTFRLTRMHTQRGNESLQDARYTYDPAGNVTSMRDEAQQVIFFSNVVVEPHTDYTYDARYRLVRARGREHASQVHSTWDIASRTGHPHPHDGQAMRRFDEHYEYDEVGNLLRVAHQAMSGAWTREYDYAEANNRLTQTTVGGSSEQYTYDAHGNITAMPHLRQLDWDFQDRLRRADLGGGGNAWYCYDAEGRRTRKVVERQNGTRQAERLYFHGFEVFRHYDAAGQAMALQRETLHVMANEHRIAQVESRTAGDDGSPGRLIRYQISDRLGSTSIELDDAGRIISHEEYYPWGATSYQAVRSQLEAPNRYRLTGKERDEETGFTFHEVRYYMPWLGRWTRPDPAGLVDGPALYSYARNNPVNLRDPGGRLAAPPPDDPAPVDLEPGQAHEIDVDEATEGRKFTPEQQAIFDDVRKGAKKMEFKELPKAPGLKPLGNKKQFGQPDVIDSIVAAAAEFERRHPGHLVRVGDISAKDGSDIGHKSHRIGNDVDIYVVFEDQETNNKLSKKPAFTNKKFKYSPEMTEELITIIHETALLPVEIVWFGDPDVAVDGRGTKRKWEALNDEHRRHRTHFHVRYKDPFDRNKPAGRGKRRKEVDTPPVPSGPHWNPIRELWKLIPSDWKPEPFMCLTSAPQLR